MVTDAIVSVSFFSLLSLLIFIYFRILRFAFLAFRNQSKKRGGGGASAAPGTKKKGVGG